MRCCILNVTSIGVTAIVLLYWPNVLQGIFKFEIALITLKKKILDINHYMYYHTTFKAFSNLELETCISNLVSTLFHLLLSFEI